MKQCLKYIGLFAYLIVCCANFSYAQIPVGSWKTHFTYDSVSHVAATENKVFAVAHQHLLSITPADGTIDTYSKIDLLASNSVQQTAYDATTKQLLIIYSDGNIDLITANGDLYNIPDFANSSSFTNKTVNNVYFSNGYAFLSCEFGIIKVNLTKYEISDTYVIGYESARLPVNGFALLSEKYYALLDSLTASDTTCVVKYAATSGTNLSDYSNWSTLNCAMPADRCKNLMVWNNTLILNTDDSGCYYYDSGSWVNFLSVSGDISMQISDGKLLVCNGSAVYICSNFTDIETYQIAANCALLKDGTLWLGTNSGVQSYADGRLNTFNVGGPATNYGQFSYYIDGKIYVCPGLVYWTRPQYPAVLQIYENGDWTNWYASATGATSLAPNNYTYNFTSVAIDPNDENRVFISSWDEGVYEYYNGQAVKIHNYESSGGVIGYCNCIGVESLNQGHCMNANCLLFDEDGILWFHNSLQAAPLKYMTQDGVWHEAASKLDCSSMYRVFQLYISENGLKWMVDNVNGLYVVDDNGTYDDSSDDEMIKLTSFTDQNGNVISPTYFYKLIEDDNNDIWLVTDLGPIVMKNTSRIFNSGYTCYRPLISRNDGSGLADFLLDGVVTKSIVKDGANRKWIGTESNGVYLISADGLTQIEHFTTSNSPLTSNDINSMAFNGETGELLIVSQDGILSYMTDSTDPVSRFTKSGPIVFPNPVRPDYTGYITIKGLEANSLVRITNSSGKVVYEGTSTGGSLSWDGKNYHGNYVAGGIYYVHCSNSSEENNRSSATKFLVIR